MSLRPRRLRQSTSVRKMLQETQLRPEDFVLPVFVEAGKNLKTPIESLPGVFRYSPDTLTPFATEAWELGIQALALFPKIENHLKNSTADEALNPEGLIPDCIKQLKNEIPELCIITDVAMDPYSSDGHDGLVQNGQILNDESLPILAQMAEVQAKAGADFVAPSDMMDGRIGFIRKHLDESNLKETGIISYAAKYASSFYGPFRDALDSAPKAGDKKTYQMDFCNSKEALKEATLDIQEAADILLVKPGLAYLDIIAKFKESFDVPVAAYNVSGEYAMLAAAADRGWLNFDQCMLESLTAFKRAGADMIFTYHAVQAAKLLRRNP